MDLKPTAHTFNPSPEPQHQPEPIIKIAFGDFARLCRTEARLTLQATAELFVAAGHPDFTLNTVCGIELGKRGVTAEEMDAFKSIFSIAEIPAHVTIRITDPTKRNSGGRKQPVTAQPEPPAPREQEATGPKAITARELSIQRAVTLLDNRRLTDEEVDGLVHGLLHMTVQILLEGVAS